MMKKIFFYFLLITFYLFFSKPVLAQTLPDPTWQTGATGLKLQPITRYYNDNSTMTTINQTSGLLFSLKDQGWPFLGVAGGAQDGGSSLAAGYTGIDLGMVKVPNVSSSALSSESADWSHDTLTYNGGSANQIALTISRLSPAILIQPQSQNLRLFSGNLKTFVNYGLTGQTIKFAPSL